MVEGADLQGEEISECAAEIVEGRATPAQVGAFLVALRQKGETVQEIASLAATLRKYSLHITPSVNGRLVDTCGTGGDKVKTFNVSTVSAFVAAGAGACVAKHGNRSVTSRCGSADLLERLGFNIGVEPTRVKESIEQIGIGFMFAPVFHPAMKRVGPVRRELGVRTVFNLMGPLINPAGADSQVVGVYSPELVEKVALSLRMLGSREAMVVHAVEGMDEISVSGSTLIARLKDGIVEMREYAPADFGVSAKVRPNAIVSGVEESASIALEVLQGRPKRDGVVQMVIANSAAALVVAGKAERLDEGVELAKESVDSGTAYDKLEQLVRFSGGDTSRIEVFAKNQ